MKRRFAKAAIALVVAASMVATPITPAFLGSSVVEAAQERTGQGVDIVNGYLAMYDVADTTSEQKTCWITVCDTQEEAAATVIGDTVGFTLVKNAGGVLEYILTDEVIPNDRQHLKINPETDADKYVAYHFQNMEEGVFLTVRVGDLLGIESEGGEVTEEEYQITYVLDGGTNANTNPAEYTQEDLPIKLADASKDGHTFDGWYTDEGLQQKITEITEVYEEGITLYAKFTANETGGTGGDGETGDEDDNGGEVTEPVTYSGMGIEYVDGKVILYANDYDGKELGADAASLVKAGVQIYDTKEAAQARMDASNDQTEIPGYPLTYSEEKECWYLETNGINVTAGKWLIINYYFEQGKVKDGFTTWQLIDTDLILAGKDTYTVEHYEQNTDSSYPATPSRTETIRDYIGAEVTAIVNPATGFAEDKEAAGTVKTGTVADGGTLTLKLYYKRGQYTITYHLDDESANGAGNPSVYMYGVGSGTLTDPTRPNSVFEGWYTTKSYTEAGKVTEVSANSVGDVDLYPKFRTTATYKVNRYFQNMDQSSYPETPETETLTGDIASTISSKDLGSPYNGFACIGSKTGTEATAVIDKDNTTEIDIYYIRKDYSIAYENVTGVTNTNPTSYVYGDSFELAAPGEKTNSVFEGWYDNAEFSGEPLTAISEYSFANLTLYAKWRTTASYITEYYLQDADLDGYTKVSADTAELTGNIGETVNAQIKEYTGYKNNSSVTGSKESAVVTADNDLVLKVYYDREVYGVSYVMNGGTNNEENPEEYTYDTGVIQLADPTKEGYTFEGWYEDEGCTGFKVAGIDTTVANARTFYANWTQDAVNPDSITLSPETLALKIDETAELTATILPANATNTAVTYRSTVPAVASVDANGLVTALEAGETTIIATTKNGKMATCQVTVREAVTGIELTETELTLEVEDTHQLTAEITPANATIKDVEWESEDTEIVSVSASGMLTAVAEGTATIIVTTVDGNHTATCEVTVTERTTPVVPVESISLDKTEVILEEGDTETLVVTFEPEEPTNKNLTWDSTNRDIVTVTEGGVITAVAEGTATITVTAADGGATASCEVTVEKKTIEVAEIFLTQTALEMQVGDEETLTAVILPAEATDTTLSWNSSDPEKVFVDGGVITALAAGNVVITVEASNGVKAECIVTVTEDTPVTVETVKLDKEFVTLTAGMTATLTATVYPLGVANKQVSWSTNNPAVATVVNGVVTAHAAGTAEITVTTAEGNKKAVCAVTVSAKPVTNYTVAFNSAGGNAIAPQTIAAGKTVVMPAAPVRAGYIFAGWYNGATAYNFATPVNSNLVLTASWTVAPVKVTSIALTGISKKIAAGKKIQLTATVAPTNASNKSILWSSSNTKYATVDANGKVSVKKAGKGKSVTITAMTADGSGIYATYTIKIMKKAVKKVTLKTSAKTVKAGKKIKITSTVSPSKDVNKTLLWTSSNTKWATVSKKGVVTTKKAGKGKTVKITAMTTDGSNKKKTIKIKIN